MGTTTSSRLREQVSYEWMETRFVTFFAAFFFGVTVGLAERAHA